MSEEGVGLISVLQRIAQALEDMDSILVELTVEVMDMHDLLQASAGTLIKEGLKTRSV